jgi:L-alanine-DL-glutamate epimerase-like enolase superfamily enzyme
MKHVLKQIIKNHREAEQAEKEVIKKELSNPDTGDDRRAFLKKAALGGISLAGFMSMSIEDTMAQTTSRVQRNSSPSELKITDMRIATIRASGRNPIIRIDTNQGIYGLGEVRDGADERYALMLKSRLLGKNPCNVEQIWKIINPFGGHGRLGGGVCGVEMALWDLCGKAYNVPAWQLLGGRYRDRIRLYADTPGVQDPQKFAEVLKLRMEEQGFTWLKMDLGIQLINNMPGALSNHKFWQNDRGNLSFWGQGDDMSLANTLHPFTQIQITDEGLERMAEYVAAVREMCGMEIPLCADHFGHFDYNNCIRLGRALEKYRLAFLEDMVAWQYTDQWKRITDALETPTCTGEDIYMLRGGFKELIDERAVDIIHPDIATSGGLLETKRIGDYAEENGIAMAMHMAGSPITLMASVHCAAATQNFLALEHHSVDTPWYDDLVIMTGSQPMITKGFANVPLDSPGLGIELNEDEIKKRLDPRAPGGYFEPTPEWDQRRSHDRTWS